MSKVVFSGLLIKASQWPTFFSRSVENGHTPLRGPWRAALGVPQSFSGTLRGPWEAVSETRNCWNEGSNSEAPKGPQRVVAKLQGDKAASQSSMELWNFMTHGLFKFGAYCMPCIFKPLCRIYLSSGFWFWGLNCSFKPNSCSYLFI